MQVDLYTLWLLFHNVHTVMVTRYLLLSVSAGLVM